MHVADHGGDAMKILIALAAAVIILTPTPTYPQSGYDIKLVNFLEAGLSRSVAVQDELLFAGLGDYLLVFDTTDPTQLARVASKRVVTQSSLRSINGIALLGSYVLTASDAGLHIFDVSDPYDLTQVGQDESNAGMDVSVSGNIAFVTALSDMRAVDISDPTTPVVIGSTSTTGWACQLEVVGQYAYISDYFGGLIVVDVSNPASPAQVANLDVGGSSFGIDVEGDFVYLPLRSGPNKLSIIDISVPHFPVEVGEYVAAGYNDVVAADGYAYLVDDYYYLDVVDVSVPTAPQFVARLHDKGGWDIAKDGDYLYVADDESSFRSIDVVDPRAPVVAGSHQAVTHGTSIAFTQDVAFVGEHGGGFRAIDIRDPSDPVFLTWQPGWGPTNDLALSGSKLFMALTSWFPDSPSGFSIFDISEPSKPISLVDVVALTLTNIYQVAPVEEYVYGVGYGHGYKLFVYDTNEVPPLLLTSLPLNGVSRAFDVAGNAAYVAAGTGGLMVFDVADPSNPAFIAAFGDDGDITDVQVVGQHAYAIDPGSGLIVIDVSDPAQPVELSRAANIGEPTSLTVVHPYVITVSSRDSVLHILNVTDPANLVEVADYETGPARDVVVNGSMIGMITGGPGSVLLLQADFLDAPTAVREDVPDPLLLRHFPNPFALGTTIEYELQSPSPVVLTIYNVRGQRVAEIRRPFQTTGRQTITWDGLDDKGMRVASGIYLYRVEARGFSQTKKMVILR
jgi:hypothetical protein